MNIKPYWLLISAAFSLLLMIPAVGFAQRDTPTVGQLFIDAYDKKDSDAMDGLIKARASEVPQEVKDMIEYAMSPGASRREQDFLFNIAGTMSQIYSQVAGDERLLGAVTANYQSVLQKRESSALPPDAAAKAKKELVELGKGDWRIVSMKMDQKGGLIVEIDVNESSGGAGFTPRVDMKQSKLAQEIISKNLPNIKKGKISWSSMGVGLKTAFLE